MSTVGSAENKRLARYTKYRLLCNSDIALSNPWIMRPKTRTLGGTILRGGSGLETNSYYTICLISNPSLMISIALTPHCPTKFRTI